MERDKAYILHILEEISNIEQFVADIEFEDFLRDIKTQKAVERSLEVIGEASKRISDEVKSKTPSVPWKEIAGMRDKITHDYFDMDYAIVWEVVQKDLHKLKNSLLDLNNLIK